MFGLGLSSKISILTLTAPILLVAGVDFYRRLQQGAPFADAAEHTLVRLLTVFGLAALTFRLVQPIAFAGPSFWNWSLNPQWQSDLLDQGKILVGDVDLPWLQQWVGRSVWFVLSNLVVWGLGIPLGLAALVGLGLACYELMRARNMAHLLPVAYVVLTFAYHTSTLVKFMRYFLPIYPFLALLGLSIGALRGINTWDFPTYTTLAGAGLAFTAYARRGRFDLALIWQVIWRMAVVLLVGQILFLPFHQAYASALKGGFKAWRALSDGAVLRL